MNVTVVRQRPNVCYIHKWVIRVLIEFRKDRFGFGLRHNSQPWVQSQQLTAQPQNRQKTHKTTRIQKEERENGGTKGKETDKISQCYRILHTA